MLMTHFKSSESGSPAEQAARDTSSSAASIAEAPKGKKRKEEKGKDGGAAKKLEHICIWKYTITRRAQEP